MINYRYLYVLFPDKDKRIMFLTSAILTFSLRLESICELLKSSPDYFYQKIMANNKFNASIYKVFTYSIKDQEKAKMEFINYFNKLEEAHKNKNEKRMKELLEVVSDNSLTKLFEEKKEGKLKSESLTDEQIVTIVKYQLKYMLSTIGICKIMDITKNYYTKRVHQLGNEYLALVMDFDTLTDSYKSFKKSEYRGGML